MKIFIQFVLVAIIIFCSTPIISSAQLMKDKEVFTHADTLRGSNNENRDWWDVLRYDITVKPDCENKTIEGKVVIKFKLSQSILSQKTLTNKYLNGFSMQIDLQSPLKIDSVIYKDSCVTGVYHGKKRDKYVSCFHNLNIHSFDNAHLIKFSSENMIKLGNATDSIVIYYHGKPREAITPPWDGGWIWKKDKQDRPWMSVACQGLGASAWYPCKDYQGDEPDKGASLTVVVPDSLVAVANGKLVSNITTHDSRLTEYKWEVTNPINNYNIVPYIGKYVNFTDTFMGEKGKLNLSFWVLDYNLENAKEQFKQAKLMLRAFEYWFGPYPFYEDDYKLVEAPHLGMEHQSAIAYGNQFKNGYLGRDLSFSGWGNKWDYIIVHESGHEWFGNNITTKDIADMWVHEGFTTYSETLFTEYYYGQKAGNEYNRGMRFNILNNKNIIGTYGVNKEGSEDMYFKGSNMIHTIRHSLNNDSLFRAILRGLNKTFYHKTVTTQEVETYINKMSGMNFTPVFNQYLRTTNIPELEFTADTSTNTLSYKWSNTVDSFNLRLVLQPTGKYLMPKDSIQSIQLTKEEIDWVINKGISKEFYIKEKSLKK